MSVKYANMVFNGILCSRINFEMTDLGALRQGGVEMNKSCANIVDLNNMVCQFVSASYVIKEVLAKALSCVFLWLSFRTLALFF